MRSETYNVYIDFKPDGVPFYVGIGNDARVKCVVRNTWHTQIRRKYPGWQRKVVEVADRKSCEEFESFLIAEIGRRDLGLGTLVNLTDGGEGASNAVVSEETRKKQSLAGKGKPKPPSFGEKISKALTGIKRTPEQIENFRKAQIGKKHNEQHRIKTAKASKERWQNEEYKQKATASLKKSWEDASRKELRSKQQIEFCSNPLVREKMSETTKQLWKTDEYRTKVLTSWKNATLPPKQKREPKYKISEEGVKNITEALNRPELKAKLSEIRKQLVWINNGEYCRRVRGDELEVLLSQGWRKGRK